MNDHKKVLDQLLHQRPELECTASSSCWCMKVNHQFPMVGGECMTPAEMLTYTKDDLSQDDVQYLTSLLGHRVLF